MTTTRVVLDPLTRIEGHLRVETEVTSGQITSAWCTGTLFRGLETILKDRDPRDAWQFTQRVCGVCTYIHGLTSVRSVENAAQASVPDDARIVRNLMTGAQFMHDHVVHFYHLMLLDWVDVVSASNGDPALAASLDAQMSSARGRDATYFSNVKSKLQTFIASGQLGPFANGYWGHPAYLLTPEENLVFVANYLEALRNQIDSAKMHAIFGGKNPHPQHLLAGGVTNSQELTTSRVDDFRAALSEATWFVKYYYLPDAIYLARKYGASWGSVSGSQNYLAYGEFPQTATEPASLYLPRGLILNRGSVQMVDTNLITEDVTHAWYAGTSSPPASGSTTPNFTGLDTAQRYSWLKAPRYNGQPMEVGPLARVLVAYGQNHADVVSQTNAFLSAAGLGMANMHSVIGRLAARAIETMVIANAMAGWANTLRANVAAGNKTVRTSFTMPTSGTGVGLNEAPRGALGHWLNFSGGSYTTAPKIGNYQMVVPSTWNFGPRDSSGVPGPMENALVGVPVADAQRPVEIIRAVHSFDPCIACAVHVVDMESGSGYEIKVR